MNAVRKDKYQRGMDEGCKRKEKAAQKTYLRRFESVDTIVYALFQTTVVLFNRLDLKKKGRKSLFLASTTSHLCSDDHKNTRTCLLSDTRCVSSCLIVITPESWEADRDVMSPCSRYMPLGGLRRARSGWWRY